MRDKCVEMRDRLIELFRNMPKEMMIDECADYLLANGAIVPIYDVGDTVYYHVLMFDKVGKFKIVNRIKNSHYFVYEIRQESGLLHFFVDEDSLYRTREEAERALKGGD